MTITNPKLPVALQPGILVGLKSEIRGGVHYRTKDLVASPEAIDVAVPDTAAVVRYETTKITDDPAEHAQALKVRNAARDAITKLCVLTPFGLVCPLANESKLDEAITEAEKIARDFNVEAKRSYVAIDAIKGYIADNNEKAARSIANAIAECLADMKNGVEKRDAEAIRASVRKAQQLAEMIDVDAANKVSQAVETARAAAREIVKTIKARGTANLILLADSNKKLFDEMAKNFTVLDLAPPVEVSPEEALAPAAIAELDVDDEAPTSPTAPTVEPADEPLLDLPPLDDDAAPMLGDVDASNAVDSDADGYADPGAMAAAPSDGGMLEL